MFRRWYIQLQIDTPLNSSLFDTASPSKHHLFLSFLDTFLIEILPQKNLVLRAGSPQGEQEFESPPRRIFLTKHVKIEFLLHGITMNIRNIQLKALKGERYLEFTGGPQKVRIDHNSNISRMEKLMNDVAKVEFQYTASYGPIGVIQIEGMLEYQGSDIVSLVNDWNTNHKMSNEIASEIHTAIMHTCVPLAVGIAKDIRLPPPIPLPQVRLGKIPTKGEAGGPEVA